MSAITSGDGPLTNEEQDALVTALFEPDDDCVHNLTPLFEEVTRILVERQAEAWDKGIHAGAPSEPITRQQYVAWKTNHPNPYRATEETS